MKIFLVIGFALVTFHFSLLIANAQIAVKGETVWTMAGGPISNGVVLIKDGKIEAVGTAASIKIPANYRVISAKVVTPGLIDAHSVVGLNGYLNQPHDQMALDGGCSIQPSYGRSTPTMPKNFSSGGCVHLASRRSTPAISRRLSSRVKR